MSSGGRPRNANGSLYPRKDSGLWWMSYRDQAGRPQRKSTGTKDREEAEKILRKLLVARDEGILLRAARIGTLMFDEWADWFLENRSKPPTKAEKTHLENINALKFLRPRFGDKQLSEITPDAIEAYLRHRLNSGRRIHTKFGVQHRGKLKPVTVHKEFRILRRILNVAVKKGRECPEFR